jgi:hypothetical protein
MPGRWRPISAVVGGFFRGWITVNRPGPITTECCERPSTNVPGEDLESMIIND